MNIRAELSSKNKYWISKNRYYELKYFCLQYNEWKDIYDNLNNVKVQTEGIDINKKLYLEKILIVEESAKETDELLYDYILKAVTQGLTYTQLYTQCSIPCSRGTYYDRYRRFFWILNKNRR